jgi:hypothetical protein
MAWARPLLDPAQVATTNVSTAVGILASRA